MSSEETVRPFRVLVTGARKATPDGMTFVSRTLTRVCGEALGSGRPVIVVQGECRSGGVDLAARRWAERMAGAESEGHPADWDQYGKAAGMIRNGEMVALGADLCVAFPAKGSRGTWDCLKRAADAGIPGRVYPMV